MSFMLRTDKKDYHTYTSLYSFFGHESIIQKSKYKEWTQNDLSHE